MATLIAPAEEFKEAFIAMAADFAALGELRFVGAVRDGVPGRALVIGAGLGTLMMIAVVLGARSLSGASPAAF